VCVLVPSAQSAIFNFQSLLIVLLLTICTCAYLRANIPSIVDRNKTGSVFARVLSPLRLSFARASSLAASATSFLLVSARARRYPSCFLCQPHMLLMLRKSLQGSGLVLEGCTDRRKVRFWCLHLRRLPHACACPLSSQGLLVLHALRYPKSKKVPWGYLPRSEHEKLPQNEDETDSRGVVSTRTHTDYRHTWQDAAWRWQ
jgi:hypothetical protein